MNLNMTKYPNKEALRTAILDIYLDAMRDFIPRSLGKVRGTTSEELISIALECEPDDSKEAIDIPNIPYLIRKYWSDIFNREFTSKRLGGDAKRVAWNATELIVETRNYVVHPNTGEIDSEYTRACLSLIADVLDKINASEEKGQVETIRDILFSDDTEERIAGMSKELEAAKADRDAYRENFKDVSDQLGVVKTERAELEEYLDTAEKEHSKQLKEVDADKAELEAHLAEVEAEKDDLKKRLKAIPDQSEVGKIERVADEERLQTALKQLKTANAVKTEVEERLETTSTRLEAVEVELTTCQEHLARTLRQLDEAKAEQTEYLSAEEHLARALTELEIEEVEDTDYEDDLAEIEEHLLPNDATPDSVTFQGTTFTLHLNKYRVGGDDISQSFWHYWHSQGREGKQEMREAGWVVERVDGDWEVTISPENFQAWIEDEVTELSSLLNFSRDEKPSTQPIRPSHEKTALPIGKEMEQPALEFLSDGREHRRVEIIDRLTEHFSLTGDERSYLSKTGQAEKHLVKEGLIERTRTGYYRITAHGLEVVDDVPF